MVNDLSKDLQTTWSKASSTEKTVMVLGGSAAAYALGKIAMHTFGTNRGAPSSFGLSAGSHSRRGNDVGSAKYNQYMSSFGEVGEGILDKEAVPGLVDTFYNLVTDIYEWGWGQSFHFAPRLPLADDYTSEIAHESYLAAMLMVKKGEKVLDVGCGVGGPMRRVMSRTGAHVTGITINDYQVNRATEHNRNIGISEFTKVVQGDFHNMPFPDGSFDAAYAIEATCHANSLVKVFSEVARVLKPGKRFVSYEWVTTPLYDGSNPEHVRIIDEINKGNGLPDMRTWKEAEEAMVKAGFKLVYSQDMAVASQPQCTPWMARLKMNRFQHFLNGSIVNTLNALHLLPSGVKEAHDMLIDVAHWLVAGGENGTFTPMHMLVGEKM